MEGFTAKTHTFLAIFFSLIIGGLLLVIAFLSLTPKGRPTCSSFGSYEDILASYHSGNFALDGDSDGIPCESRKPR